MIKSTELRIGNWVMILHEDDETFRQINGDDIAMIELCEKDPDRDEWSRGKPTDYIVPILLTPEVLNKCMFEWDIFYQGFSDSRGFLYLQEANTDGYNIFNGKWKQRINFLDSIKYLHQLQNFYFSITGKELSYQP